MDQGVIATFKKYYLCPTFHQAVKVSDKSGSPCNNFGRTITSTRPQKNIDSAWPEVTAITMNGVWKKLCPQFVHNFRGFEKVDEESKEVFIN